MVSIRLENYGNLTLENTTKSSLYFLMLNFHSFLERNLINYSILNIECYRAKTYELCKKRSFFKTKLNNHLTLSVPEKLKNSIF